MPPPPPPLRRSKAARDCNISHCILSAGMERNTPLADPRGPVVFDAAKRHGMSLTAQKCSAFSWFSVHVLVFGRPTVAKPEVMAPFGAKHKHLCIQFQGLFAK